MACYPCIHCNKCGMYSVTAQTQCATCSLPIPIGIARCPRCGGSSFVVAPVDSRSKEEKLASGTSSGAKFEEKG